MSKFAFVAGGLLPGVTVIVFIAGMAYRIRKWLQMPQPGKMTLFPAAKNPAKAMMAEAVLFPSLFRGDRALWALAWIFHIMLALILLTHIRVVTGLMDRMLMGFGMVPQDIRDLFNTMGETVGIIILVAGVLMLFRRLSVRRVREISGFSDFFALVLLVGIILTGVMLHYGPLLSVETTRIWASSLLRLSPRVPHHGLFLVHLILACILIMFIPFSKILHYGGFFFTRSLFKRKSP